MGPHAKLPVGATTRLAYKYAFGHLGSLFRLAWPWLALLVVWNAVLPWLLDPRAILILRTSVAFKVNAVLSINIPSVDRLVDGGIDIAAGILTAVAWHRAILLSEPIGWWPRIRRHEWRYLWIWILTGIVVAIPVVVLVLVSSSGSTFMSIAGAYGWAAAIGWMVTLWGVAGLVAMAIGGRIGLALPAAAIRTRLTLRQSFRRTAGNTWRLLSCSLLVLGPYYLISLASSLITTVISLWFLPMTLRAPPTAMIIGAAAACAAGLWVLLGVVLLAGMLSFSFYFLHLRPQAVSARAPAAPATAPAE